MGPVGEKATRLVATYGPVGAHQYATTVASAEARVLEKAGEDPATGFSQQVADVIATRHSDVLSRTQFGDV
jgi:hypothetical protein